MSSDVNGVGEPPQVTVTVTPACMGVAMCAAAAPGHFAVVNGRSTPLANPTAVTDEFWDAVTSCPVSALEVRDARSGDLLDAD